MDFSSIATPNRSAPTFLRMRLLRGPYASLSEPLRNTYFVDKVSTNQVGEGSSWSITALFHEDGVDERLCYADAKIRPSGLSQDLRMPSRPTVRSFTRRELLKGLALAPAAFHASPLFPGPLLPGFLNLHMNRPSGMPFADLRMTPIYPAKSPLSDIFALVAPGSDSY